MSFQKSNIQQILDEASNYIQKHPLFKNLQVHTDWSTLGPNNSFPCISILEGKGYKLISSCPQSVTFEKEIAIYIHTTTQDKIQLKNELRTYKEQLLLHMIQGDRLDQITSSSPTSWTYKEDDNYTMYNQNKTGVKSFFCNVAEIQFQLEYTLPILMGANM